MVNVHEISHKQNIPKTARRWSLNAYDVALLKFGFFWESVEVFHAKP
jgi:ribosomal protein L28